MGAGTGEGKRVKWTHVWWFKPRLPGEPNRKGMRCLPMVYGRKNSVLVLLESGEKVITSRYAIRKIPVDRASK